MLHLYPFVGRFDECVEGGMSVVLDAYPVVEEMRRKHSKQFDTLTRVPVRYARKQSYTEYVCMHIILFVDYLSPSPSLSLSPFPSSLSLSLYT